MSPLTFDQYFEIPMRFLELGEITHIGGGASSQVYKISGDRDYALKVISSEEEWVQEQALHEIEILKKLRACSGVIHLLDSEVVTKEKGRTVYILEEYGMPLIEYLHKKSMQYAERIRLLEELCDALIQCRNAGVMHRDIKPHNIFLNNEGKVCLGDFGVSLLLSELENNRFVIGTPMYMAPEVHGFGIASEQTEIYAVGMMLYQFFDDSKRPRTASYDELMLHRRLMGEPLPELTLQDAEFQQALMNAIWKICAFNPTQRPTSFEELRRILFELRMKAAELAQKDEKGMIIYLNPVALTVAMTVAHPVGAGGYDWHSRPKHDCEEQGYGGSMSSALESYLAAGDNGKTVDGYIHYAKKYYEEDNGWNGKNAGSSIPAAAPKSQFANEIDAVSDFESCSCCFCGARMDLNARVCKLCGNINFNDKPKVEIRNIQISATAPKRFIKGDYSIINVVLYEDNYRNIVDALKGDNMQEARTTAQVTNNAKIRVCLNSPDIEIEDNIQEAQWFGKYLDFGFAVFLPEKYAKRTILFRAQVYIDGVMSTRLTFSAKCSSILAQKLQITRNDILSAFVSYASQDRAEVIRVVQGMRQARPDMDIFLDVEKLRSGEDWAKTLYAEIDQRDMLVLCWSRSAKKSQWVDREWRYALEQKGIEAIDPVPIEPAEVCPPPTELESKHFNDLLLYLSPNKSSYGVNTDL